MTGVAAILEAEAHALTLWVEPECRALGEWELRTVPEAPGLRLPRTNSCLAIGDPGLPLAEAIAEVRAFYVALDRPALARVEVGTVIEGALLDGGWGCLPHEETSSFHVAGLESARAAAGPAGRVETVIDSTRLLAVLILDGQEVGRVRGELNAGWLGVHGLLVAEASRRRGHARALMSGLLDAGGAAGATTVWLEVADDNAPALALYGGLGLRRHHRCRYLSAPEN